MSPDGVRHPGGSGAGVKRVCGGKYWLFGESMRISRGVSHAVINVRRDGDVGVVNLCIADRKSDHQQHVCLAPSKS